MIAAAKEATSTIPIVMAGAGTEPVSAGFVRSLAKPGGNIRVESFVRGSGCKETRIA
jgi:ABC-type uncharacterized transport system substrate-binding protein